MKTADMSPRLVGQTIAVSANDGSRLVGTLHKFDASSGDVVRQADNRVAYLTVRQADNRVAYLTFQIYARIGRYEAELDGTEDMDVIT